MSSPSSNLLQDNASFLRFLETKTAIKVESSTSGPPWNDVQTIVSKYSDDKFTWPPLENYFLGICTKGSGVADIRFKGLIGPQKSLVEPGMLWFVPAGRSAECKTTGNFEIAQLLLSCKVVDEVLVQRCHKKHKAPVFQGFHGRRYRELENIILELVESVKSHSQKKIITDALVLEIARTIVDYTCECFCGKDASIITPLQFVVAVDYIDGNLTRSLDIEEVASQVGVGVARFADGFEIEADNTFSDFHMLRRLGIVTEWLKGTYSDMSSEKIAQNIGFETVDELDSAFRTHMGVSFESYRKRGLG